MTFMGELLHRTLNENWLISMLIQISTTLISTKTSQAHLESYTCKCI